VLLKPQLTYLKTLYENWHEHRVPRLSAGLAYYTIFSLAPILVLLTAGVSLVLGESDVQIRLFAKVQEVYGDRVLSIVQELVEGFLRPGAGRFATVISAITILYGSTRVFVQLQDALNAIWEVETRVRLTIFARLRRRSQRDCCFLWSWSSFLRFRPWPLSLAPCRASSSSGESLISWSRGC